MKQSWVVKYATFFLIVMALVVVDQWTKHYASDRLATQRPGVFSHNMVLEIGPEHDGATLEAYLRDELSANTEQEVQLIAERYTITPHGQLLQAESELAAGDEIEIRHREVVVIEGFWDFQYTRNPGAAFGFLANSAEEFRKPFFLIITIIAGLFVLVLLRGLRPEQKLFFSGLTLIAAGAVGNFIDRVRFDYVIDFVVWKYTDEFRWPTFNVADVLICVGVAILVVEMFREGVQEYKEKKSEIS